MTNDDAKRLAGIRERKQAATYLDILANLQAFIDYYDRDEVETVDSQDAIAVARESKRKIERLLGEIERLDDLVRLYQAQAANLQCALDKANAQLALVPPMFTITSTLPGNRT